MELRDGMDTMSLDGSSLGVPLRGLDAAGLRSVIYVNVFPNILLSLHPDYVMTHRLTPVPRTAPGSSAPGPSRPRRWRGRASMPGYAVEFWDITNRQDWWRLRVRAARPVVRARAAGPAVAPRRTPSTSTSP